MLRLACNLKSKDTDMRNCIIWIAVKVHNAE